MASASSSSSHRSPRSMAFSGQSPVPYREPPMAYSPEKVCHCKVKAPRWISWSIANPGRRYYNCSQSLGYDCGYFKWHDDPLDKFVSTLLGDLRDVVNRLKTEVRKLKTEKS
ncbi:hypothetical protein CFC21_037630 [Triticum aestivum]|uniref:GRF-type domain-containing protein n=3 Tax=Triticum TaxID=4564 RepID=A0A9R0RXA5_TRITD|nr:hypothetical protein CFC21_037630 [Triticum aestivum]VAH67919.1 unnamed protein product [Triticum turgidum subsp. durum]